MTEQELIDTLKALEADAATSYQRNISGKPYDAYIRAMYVVIERYRETSPGADTTEHEQKVEGLVYTA